MGSERDWRFWRTKPKAVLDLTPLQGQWVAVMRDAVIATGTSPAEIFDRIQKRRDGGRGATIWYEARPEEVEVWRDFAAEDRRVITAQHGLVRAEYVRLGAVSHLPTRIANAEQALAEAEEELRSAQYRVKARSRDLAELRRAAPEGDTNGE